MPADTGPLFRLWPPVSVGVPLLIGLGLSSVTGDDLDAGPASVTAGLILVAAFVVWNGWALVLMARHRTALLPGGATTTILDRGPFGLTRNPLYVGLLVLSAGLALLLGSTWALAMLPAEWALLHWGAVLPEERYLTEKFGAVYEDYRSLVRRWV